MQRHFCWHRNILFAHELDSAGVDTLIILSGADRIVPSDAVMTYLRKHKLESANSKIHAVYLEDAPHGGERMPDWSSSQINTFE